MKKSLVLAMAMALGVTASAYAANPFSDVPAGHWAYDSVAKLAAAGVVDGYGDTTFGGDKLMTRYEMAQIVAKAMAKGANVDKLAAEFADELDTLGVRVANLEKKADNVKITGNVRYHYADLDKDGYDTGLRSRIWINGQVNEDWSYTGMLQNMQDLKDNAGNEKTDFQRAYVEGRLGGLDVTAGRYNKVMVNGNLYDHRFDGVEVSYGKDVKVSAFYGKPTEQDKEFHAWTSKNGKRSYRTAEFDTAYGANIAAKFGAVKANVGYTVFDDGVTTKYSESAANKGDFAAGASADLDENKIWNVGVEMDLSKDLTLTADYMRASDCFEDYVVVSGDKIMDEEDGYVIGLSYKGAKASEAGSYGLYANYYDQSRATVVAHTMNGNYGSYGFEGYMVGADYALAKNIVAAVEYYDLDSKDAEETSMKTLWTEVVFSF